MARIVETHIKPLVTLSIQTLMTDGSVSVTELHEGDIVNSLRYIEDGDIKTVSGKVRKFNLKQTRTNRDYSNITKVRSYFNNDVSMEKIDIDCSKEYESNIISIPLREIVEDSGVKDVERMMCLLNFGVKFDIELTDDTTNSFELFEGDELVDLEYLDKGSISKINAKLVAIDYDADMIPTRLILIHNDKILIIPVLAIKDIGTALSQVYPNISITHVISNYVFDTVPLSAGVFVENIDITKDITIKGAQAGVPATYRSPRTSKSNSLETVLSGKLTVEENVSVTLDGITLTESAYLNLKNVKEVTLKNCRVLNLTSEDKRPFVILSNGTEPTKLVISNCYFGPNDTSDNKFYNLFELNSPLASGSQISGNYFDKDICTNNSICIYNVVDDSVVTIKNNTWEKATNGIRVGTKGSAKCTIDIVNNTYFDTDIEWAGLVLLQPYGKSTTSMKDVTVNIDKTKHNDKFPIYYLYNGANDMQFDDTNIPTIKIDGVAQTKLIIKK